MLSRFGFGSAQKSPQPDDSPEPEFEKPIVIQTKRPEYAFSTTSVAGGPARPLRLVYCDERGKFKMDPEAVAALHMVKGPLGVVAVCGRARQGKSFILNQVRELSEDLWEMIAVIFYALAVEIIRVCFWYCRDCILSIASR